MSCHGECLSTRGEYVPRNSGHALTCVDNPQRHDSLHIREVPVALGLITFRYRCSCGAAGYAPVEADIRKAHPKPRQLTGAERGPVLTVVKQGAK